MSHKKGKLFMSEEKFMFDIENLKQDLGIEDMVVTNDDIDMLKRYSNNEFTMNEMIDNIKQSFQM